MAKQSRPVGDYVARPFTDGVLAEELRLIERRRAGLRDAPDEARPSDTGKAASVDVTARCQHASTFGVTFSGGGIRSATFNLGVLQGLAEKGLLPYVDYLSTVSGGGYIGAWLHGLIRRQGGDPRAAGETLLAGTDRPPGPPDTDPITFLRKYSNYLAPRPGLFSADSWVGAVIWIRNVLLNQLILIPAIASVAATAFLLVLIRQVPFVDRSDVGFNPVSAAIGIVSLLIAVIGLVANLRPIARQSFTPEPVAKNRLETLAERHSIVVVIAVLLAAASVAYGDFNSRSILLLAGAAVSSVVLMMVIQWGGGFVRCFAERHRLLGGARAPLHVLWMSTLSGLATTGLVWSVWKVLERLPPWAIVAFAPPLIALPLISGVMLLVGLMGADYPDAAREWTARIGSQVAIGITAWAALAGLTIFGPWAVAWLFGNFQRIGLGAMAVWLLTTVGGVLAGRSPRTKAGGGSGGKGFLELLVNVAPTVFLIGYVIAIAAAVHLAVVALTPAAGAPPPGATAPEIRYEVDVKTTTGAGVEVTVDPNRAGLLERWMAPAARYADRYFEPLTVDYAADGWAQMRTLSLLLVGFIVAAVIASSRINVNEFSLHHFYKNRLVRCYLGASNSADGRRRPNLLTGFDPRDDFPLSALHADSPRPDGEPPYLGPYPIVNATLNLNTGAELAQQERKAASFVFTPAFCGFDPPSSRESAREIHRTARGMDAHGYRPTRGYAQAAGPDVGTAVAISGAAANPNWGYHTSGPMAFLLTVFNARLGWWLGNPRWLEASRHSGPKFALKYLLAELLGQTTARTRFVNLSDGGHFENLGLYELVRRRCRFIIVSDSEEDAGLTFGSLGGAIRKCRADFGVEIDIDPSPIQKDANGFSGVHCVVGRIRYPEPERAFVARMTEGLAPAQGTQTWSQGWLLYLKSSLTGDEPADVLEYRSRFSEFPHQSTADQFFSESQFESYRRLGYHVFRSAFADVRVPGRTPLSDTVEQTSQPYDAALLERYPLVRTFQDLTRKWYASIPVSAEAASRLADAYVTIMGRLARDKAAAGLYAELLGTASPSAAARPTASPDAALIAAGIELLQLVENVYTEFGFEAPFNEHNPRNAGWMNLFRQWMRSDILYAQIWPHIASTYHPFFQRFVNRLRNGSDEEPTRL